MPSSSFKISNIIIDKHFMKWICLALKLLKSQLSIEDKEVTRVYRILTEKMKTMLDKNVSWGKEKWKVVSDKTMIINST